MLGGTLVNVKTAAAQFFTDFGAGRFHHLRVGNVLIVAGRGLGGRREDWLWKLLAFAQTGCDFLATDGPVLPIFLPAGAGEVAPDDALDGYDFRLVYQHAAALKHARLLGK